MQRDRQVNEQLAAAGWTVLRFWESETLADPNRVAREIAERVRGRPVAEFRRMDASPVERRRLGSVRTMRGLRSAAT